VKLYLDANIIIFGHEAADPLKQLVLRRLVACCEQPDGQLATSIFSRLECRVLPLRTSDKDLLAQYDEFFGFGGVEVIGVTEEIIDLATELRAKYGFKSPDAIHLASAIAVGAQVFLTADAALRKCAEIAVEVMTP
jgi:predicted nucleic acid-binding protein